jgi:hypothetical protein
MRRSWSRIGERAILPQKQGFQNSYLFTALEPLTGESFHLIGFADMDTDTELAFLTELKKQYSTEHVIVVIDNAPCHKPKCLHIIPGLTIIYLPSYSPELNPVERFFEEIRRATACEVFETLALVEERITKAVNGWSDDLVKMKNLICYPWIKEQIGVVS